MRTMLYACDLYARMPMSMPEHISIRVAHGQHVHARPPPFESSTLEAPTKKRSQKRDSDQGVRSSKKRRDSGEQVHGRATPAYVSMAYIFMAYIVMTYIVHVVTERVLNDPHLFPDHMSVMPP